MRGFEAVRVRLLRIFRFLLFRLDGFPKATYDFLGFLDVIVQHGEND